MSHEIIKNIFVTADRRVIDEALTTYQKAVTIPCTGCRYCCAGCPKKLDIPNLINLYNDIIVYSNLSLIHI